MIGLGATLVAKFSWLLHIFALFLIITGIKMIFMGEKLPDIDNNPIQKFIRKHFRISKDLNEDKFTVKLPDPKTGKIVTYGTPLLLALVLIEFIDLIFALDSIPAIFTITLDPYIVYTSNIFAILGLRALYFALAAIIQRFKYLKQALAFVLIFIGSKGFIAYAMGMEKFPASISLMVTFLLIFTGIVVSLYKTRNINNIIKP
jgi:tellurite resistance protein TerC